MPPTALLYGYLNSRYLLSGEYSYVAWPQATLSILKQRRRDQPYSESPAGSSPPSLPLPLPPPPLPSSLPCSSSSDGGLSAAASSGWPPMSCAAKHCQRHSVRLATGLAPPWRSRSAGRTCRRQCPRSATGACRTRTAAAAPSCARRKHTSVNKRHGWKGNTEGEGRRTTSPRWRRRRSRRSRAARQAARRGRGAASARPTRRPRTSAAAG
eukprot:COSAG04_NODE_2962_length_3342_cov_2.461918_2_plen_211_part_00